MYTLIKGKLLDMTSIDEKRKDIRDLKEAIDGRLINKLKALIDIGFSQQQINEAYLYACSLCRNECVKFLFSFLKSDCIIDRGIGLLKDEDIKIFLKGLQKRRKEALKKKREEKKQQIIAKQIKARKQLTLF